MPDGPQKGRRDRIRVNRNQEHEIRYWAGRLGIPAALLLQAIDDVGPMVDEIEAWLEDYNEEIRTNARLKRIAQRIKSQL
jgi:hypothetical protein